MTAAARWRLAGGGVLAVALLALFFRGVDWSALVAALRSANPGFLLGVVLLANLTGGSRPKSLAMVVLGIMLSTVGMDPLGGTVRFTFEVAGAQAGLSFIAVTAGLFGVAEVLATMAAPASTAPVAHVDLYAKAIPQAVVRRLRGRDHQLNNDMSEVAADIRCLRLGRR